MQARDVMTREIVTVRPETRVSEIARILTARRISGVPVVDSGDHVVGVVTEADLTSRPECETDYPRHSWLARLVLSPEQSAADYTKTHGLHAADVMTSPPVTVGEDTPVDEVARVLDEKHIRRVPVVRGERLVGIVSRADLLAGLARSKDAEVPANAADQAIYDKLTESLKRELANVRGVTTKVRHRDIGRQA